MGADSGLEIEVELPYGTPGFDPASRSVRPDAASAGRVSMGRDVRVAPGVVVRVRVEGNGRLRIPDGAVLSESCERAAGPGETVVLGAAGSR
jgi:carbonic anhydrase/acetyltransferase-like protein (isoleucine patch superfamily)